MRRLLAVTFATLLAIAGLGVPIAAASSDNVGGRIVFSRQLLGGGAATYTVRPIGGHQSLVPSAVPNEDFGRAVWSHDGARLLLSNILRFDDQGELLPFRPAVMRPNGRGFRLLELPAFGFDSYCSAWSPDDRGVLCGLSEGSRKGGLWVIRASDGKPLQRLTDQSRDLAVGYSRSGSRLAFLRYQGDDVALFVSDRNGGHARQLTPYGLLDGDVIAAADWGPRGDVIVSSSRGRLVLIDASTGELTAIPLATPGPNYAALTPSFSPDGRRVAFSFVDDNHPPTIYTAKVDGTDLRPVAGSDTAEFFPDWTDRP